jgi:trafficking protein particle complex subunit 1
VRRPVKITIPTTTTGQSGGSLGDTLRRRQARCYQGCRYRTSWSTKTHLSLLTTSVRLLWRCEAAPHGSSQHSRRTLLQPSSNCLLAPPCLIHAVMTVHSFYLFDRLGTCLCYREWARTLSVHTPDDDQKTMFGMLYALRNFAVKLSPSTPESGIPNYFATDVYALHYFETPTGLRFVLTTSKDFGNVDIARCLHDIYSDIYVEFVVKNPLYVRGAVIQSDFFLSKLDACVGSLPCF